MIKKSVVKNRAPAPIQITAEQILLEANQRKEEFLQPPRRRIADAAELAEYRMGKRKAFEDELRRQRHHVGTWMKYAAWEESQEEFARARSIFERALDVDYKATTIWLKYADFQIFTAIIEVKCHLYILCPQIPKLHSEGSNKHGHLIAIRQVQ